MAHVHFARAARASRRGCRAGRRGRRAAAALAAAVAVRRRWDSQGCLAEGIVFSILDGFVRAAMNRMGM